MRTVSALSLALLLVAPAQAEEDYMEVQRCIWRCMADTEGAGDDAYPRCVERRCSDGETPKRNPSKARSNRSPTARLKFLTATDGVWTYGDHPKLGRSAYVNMGQEAYGIACIDRPDSGYSAAVRVTKGLVPRASEVGGVITSFSQPFSTASGGQYTQGTDVYFEELGDACLIPLDRLRQSKELIYLKGSKPSFTMEGDLSVLEYERAGTRIRVSNQAELDAVTDKIVVPLKGSTLAIKRLVAACPSLRRSVAQGCDLGD